MPIRDIKLEDMLLIEKIHSMNGKEFPLPDLNDPSYIIKKVVVSESGMVNGAVIARLTSEVLLILDPRIRGLDRTRIYKDSVMHIMSELLKRGIKTTHVFILPETDNQHAEVLRRHFGFVNTTGIPLYLELE